MHAGVSQVPLCYFEGQVAMGRAAPFSPGLFLQVQFPVYKRPWCGSFVSRGLDFVRAVQAPGLSLSSACFWSSSPQPPQPQVPETPWADEGGSVYHLTDEDFDQFVKEHSSVLVMFHAPCEWNSAAPPSPFLRVGHHLGTLWMGT